MKISSISLYPVVVGRVVIVSDSVQQLFMCSLIDLTRTTQRATERRRDTERTSTQTDIEGDTASHASLIHAYVHVHVFLPRSVCEWVWVWIWVWVCVCVVSVWCECVYVCCVLEMCRSKCIDCIDKSSCVLMNLFLVEQGDFRNEFRHQYHAS